VAKPADQKLKGEVEETQAPKGDEEGEPEDDDDDDDDDEQDGDLCALPTIERLANIRKADWQPLDSLSRKYGTTG